MSRLPKLKISVELDCLLDTRIGTVALIDQALATEVLKNGYHDRIEDKFEGVDQKLYKELYANRNTDTLKVSTITTFLPLLRHLCDLIQEESISRPYHSGPEVDVNIYPYYMTDDLADAIGSAIMQWLGPLTPVNVVRVEPKDMTPQFCKEYSLLVMYDPTEWVNLHLDGIVKKPLRDVSLYIPQILRNNTLTDEELKATVEEFMDPFAALDLFLKPIIDLTQLDAKFFSIFRPTELLDFSAFHFSSVPENPQTSG